MKVDVKFGNVLTVDDRILTTADGDVLATTLREHRATILDSMYKLLHRLDAGDPGRLHVLPSVWVAYLGPRTVVIATEVRGREVFYDQSSITEAYWPLWDIVLQADFKPEVRWASGGLGPLHHEGMYLLVSKPE